MQEFIKKFKILLLCISGLLTGLTVVFPKVGFLEWITLVPMALVLLHLASDRAVKLKYMYLYGAVFFMSFYLVIFHWFLYMYPMDFIDGMSKGVAVAIVIVAWIGMSILQTLSSSLIFLVFAFIFRCRIFEKFKICAPFLAAALWATIEWSQTIGWWGVPWGRLCLGQTETSLNLLSASLFGSYFVTFLIVAVNFCLAYVFLSQKYAKVLSTVCVTMLVGNMIVGGVIMAVYNTSATDESNKRTFAVVQGNVALDEKWSSGTIQKIEDAHTEYTIKAGELGADVVVWAETAFPYDIDNSLREYMSELAKVSGTTIIASSFIEPEIPVISESGRERSLNCIYEVRKDGTISEEFYAKQRRVPFAEFLPFRTFVSAIFPALAELNMIPDDVIPGEESTVLHTEAGNIGGAICFDSVYENLSIEAVRNGAQVIIVATNDAWFDDSAENYMHTSQSKLRAIETGRYVVRAANTGISCIINPMGEFEERLGIDEEGLVIGEIYLRDSNTLYTIIGNTFVYICAALCTLGIFVAAFVQIKDKKAGKRA